jgi:hypothetical protein
VRTQCGTEREITHKMGHFEVFSDHVKGETNGKMTNKFEKSKQNMTQCSRGAHAVRTRCVRPQKKKRNAFLFVLF